LAQHQSIPAPELNLLQQEHERKMSALSADLQKLKPSALQRRAVSEGVDTAELDAALDSDEPLDSLVQLILAQHSMDQRQQEAHAKMLALLTAELKALKPSALQKRAAAEGVDEAALEAALDSDDPPGTLISV
jgi:2-hydroxychromene-2-carboxylate isomerase